MKYLTEARRRVVDSHVEPPSALQESDSSPERGETAAQRADRNLGELLQELRVAQTGVQLLFGFLLAIAFTPVFTASGSGERLLYGVTVMCCTVSFALIVGPVAAHRVLFRQRAKMVVVVWSHLLTLVGLAAMLATVAGGVGLAIWQAAGPTWAAVCSAFSALLLMTLWFLLPLALRRSVADRHWHLHAHHWAWTSRRQRRDGQ